MSCKFSIIVALLAHFNVHFRCHFVLGAPLRWCSDAWEFLTSRRRSIIIYLRIIIIFVVAIRALFNNNFFGKFAISPLLLLLLLLLLKDRLELAHTLELLLGGLLRHVHLMLRDIRGCRRGLVQVLQALVVIALSHAAARIHH